MNYIKKHCPHCKGELQIPDNLHSCVCMYCSKTILVKYLVDDSENCKKYEKECFDAITKGPSILSEHLGLMNYFNAKEYKSKFIEYKEKCQPILITLDKACTRLSYFDMEEIANKEFAVNSQEELMLKWVEHLLTVIPKVCSKKSNRLGFRKTRRSFIDTKKLEECRLIMALYMVPMILETKLDIAELLVDIILTEWEKQYPKQKFSKAKYIEIQDGFQNRKFLGIRI